MEWQVNLKRRAFARSAVHPDVSIALFDDAVNSRQAEPCALASFLCGEEGFKDVCQDCQVHSCSAVAYRQKHVISGPGTRMRARIGLVQMRIASLDLQLAACGHRVTRIDR